MRGHPLTGTSHLCSLCAQDSRRRECSASFWFGILILWHR